MNSYLTRTGYVHTYPVRYRPLPRGTSAALPSPSSSSSPSCSLFVFFFPRASCLSASALFVFPAFILRCLRYFCIVSCLSVRMFVCLVCPSGCLSPCLFLFLSLAPSLSLFSLSLYPCRFVFLLSLSVCLAVCWLPLGFCRINFSALLPLLSLLNVSVSWGLRLTPPPPVTPARAVAFLGATQRHRHQKQRSTPDSPCDRRALLKGFAAGVLGTAVVVGTGTGFEVLPGVDTTAAFAAEIGTKQSPIAVVGAGGEWREELSRLLV